MPCTIEPLTAPEIFLLRAGAKHFAYGDPYVMAGVIEQFGPYAAIKGVNGQLDVSGLRAELIKIGVRSLCWERSKGGVFISHSHEL